MSEPKRDLMGIDIGLPGDPRQPSLDNLRMNGVVVDRSHLSQMRAGDGSGVIKVFQAADFKTVGKGDASLKDQLYLEIINGALKLKGTLPKTKHGSWKTESFTSDLNQELYGDRSDQAVRLAFRAMRADMSLGAVLPWQRGFINRFSISVEDYKRVFTRAPSLTPPFVAALNASQMDSLEGFYSLLYDQGPRTISSWLMFELEAMKIFYTNQNDAKNRLTIFDWNVFTYAETLGLDSELASARLTKDSGVSLDEHVLTRHRTALISGKLATRDEFTQNHSLKR